MTDAPTPRTQIEAAVAELRRVLGAAGVNVDPLTAGWAEIETGVARLLGGPFDPGIPQHASITFMLAAALAERLRRDLGGFWFRHRGTPAGAALGFAEALVVFSPFETIERALSQAKLGSLDAVPADLKGVLAKATAAARGQTPKLGPAEYQRLFDPGFAQFVCLDPMGMEAALGASAQVTARELERGFKALPASVPAQAREPMRKQLADALARLDAGTALGGQIARAPQLIELVTFLQSETGVTSIAQEELWQDVLLPLLHIGGPTSFPDLDEDQIAAFKSGVDPVLLLVDVAPFATPAADEDGLFGVFPPETIGPIDARFTESVGVNLLRLPVSTLAKPVASFDTNTLRASVQAFRAHCVQQAGGEPQPQPSPEGEPPPLIDAAVTLLDELVRVVKAAEAKTGVFCLRRLTEAEAASEPLIHAVRTALKAPRIVLA